MTPSPGDPEVAPAGAPAAEPGTADAYRAVRAHELMLNEASSALERAVVAPLLTLNGGAAVAFLTLLGALGRDAQLNVDVAVARVAIGHWMLGLLVAAVAASVSASRQASLNRAHRLMREEVEEVLFPRLAAVIAPETLAPGIRDRRRVEARDKARSAALLHRVLWMGSALAFLIGGALAMFAVGPPA